MKILVELDEKEIDFIRLSSYQFMQSLDGHDREVANILRTDLICKFSECGYNLDRNLDEFLAQQQGYNA